MSIIVGLVHLEAESSKAKKSLESAIRVLTSVAEGRSTLNHDQACSMLEQLKNIKAHVDTAASTTKDLYDAHRDFSTGSLMHITQKMRYTVIEPTKEEMHALDTDPLKQRTFFGYQKDDTTVKVNQRKVHAATASLQAQRQRAAANEMVERATDKKLQEEMFGSDDEFIKQEALDT